MSLHTTTSVFRVIKGILLLGGLALLSRLMSILVLCAGLYWIYDGFSRGAKYHALIGQEPQQLEVRRLENRNHRRYFPDYVATGYVNGNTSLVTVAIFKNQFRRLRPGSSLDVHQLPSGEWVNHAKLEESKPIFAVSALRFSWHVPGGIVLLVGWFGLAPYFERKQKRTTAIPTG